jgi:Xaa-Pro aminopeptidase
MAQRRWKAGEFHNQNVYTFPRAVSGPKGTSVALDLVYQAAEMFRDLQDGARETEARAQSLCRAASEKVRIAEARAEAAEQAYRELMLTADEKLQDASRALAQAQSNICIQEDKLLASEFRAQKAEAEVREVKQALALVEEAIRRRLLTSKFEERDKPTAVA